MEEFVNLKIRCPYCGTVSIVRVKGEDYDRYARGEGYIHTCFPYLDITDREKLITGFCKKCQEDIFDFEED